MGWKLVVVILILGVASGRDPTKAKLSDTIDSLRHTIRQLQSMSDDKAITAFSKGLFPTYYETNLFGSKEMVFLRHALRSPDNTIFATTIIFQVLLELSDFDLLTETDVNNMASAIDTLNKFKDKYMEGEHSIMTYWEQVADEDGNWINSYTDDYLMPEERVAYVNSLQSLLLKSGFAEDEIAKAMPYIFIQKVGYAVASLPADMDSTSVTLAFGSLLKKYSKLYPSVHERWSSYNTNVTQSTSAVFKKYTYRPLSEDKNVNTISTKSYYFLKDFIHYRRAQGDRDIALPLIWRIFPEDFGKHNQLLVSLHNEIDVTVCSNVVTGITFAVTSGLWDPSVLDDPELQNVYLDTISMLIYQVRNNFSNKVAYGLPYYASKHQVYWWLSRIYSHLENIIKSGEPLPHQALYTVHSEVKDALRTAVTQLLLQEGQSDSNDEYFYDDFVGYLDPEDANPQTVTKVAKEVRKQMFGTIWHDKSDQGQAGQSDRQKEDKVDSYIEQSLYNTIKEVNKYQITKHGDRIFTTALAANVLLSAWTYRDVTSGKLVWDDATPCRVERLVERVVTWLDRHTLSGEYRPDGCIYTATPVTEKGEDRIGNGSETDPFPSELRPTSYFMSWRYPFNVNTYMNGTERHGVDDLVGFYGIIGVSGVIPEEEYEQKLKEMWADDDWINTPRDFKDPDVVHGLMVYTSDAYTYMTALSALTKYAALQ